MTLVPRGGRPGRLSAPDGAQDGPTTRNHPVPTSEVLRGRNPILGHTSHVRWCSRMTLLTVVSGEVMTVLSCSFWDTWALGSGSARLLRGRVWSGGVSPYLTQMREPVESTIQVPPRQESWALLLPAQDTPQLPACSAWTLLSTHRPEGAA